MKLFSEYYQDKNPARNAELQEVFKRNSMSIDPYYVSICTDKENEPENAFISFTGRPTFNDLFRIANEGCDPGEVAIIANSDIFFDETIKLAENIKENEVYALSRWDVMDNGRAKPFHRADSQDVWIFRTPIKEIEGADFTCGTAGCDNKLALLLEQAGYKVTNPCKSIHAFHLHLSGVRNYIEKGKVIDRIPPPYKLITPTEL